MKKIKKIRNDIRDKVRSRFRLKKEANDSAIRDKRHFQIEKRSE